MTAMRRLFTSAAADHDSRPSRAPRPSLLLLLLVLLAAPLAALAEEVVAEVVHVENVVPLHGSSLQPPFIDSGLGNRWWNFGGDVVVDVNNYMRLTPDRQSKNGWIWSKIPLSSNSWVIEFEFKVHGASSTLFGDGFAFWFTAEKEMTGPVFGSKDYFNGLGVFFDTYANGRRSKHTFPYISVMIGDGKTHYDHDQDGEPQEIGGCSADFRGKDFPTKAKIKFVRNGYLQVQIIVKDGEDWEDCVITQNVTLPTMGYLGFTAVTGDVSDNHDVLRVTTNGIINPDIDRFQPASPAKKKQWNTSTNMGWGFLTWFFIIIGILIAAYVLFFIVREMNAKSNKRF